MHVCLAGHIADLGVQFEGEPQVNVYRADRGVRADPGPHAVIPPWQRPDSAAA